MKSDTLSVRFGRDFRAGEVLFREGETGAEMFVISSGRVKGSWRNNRPPTATATALEDVSALAIDAGRAADVLTGSIVICDVGLMLERIELLEVPRMSEGSV